MNFIALGQYIFLEPPVAQTLYLLATLYIHLAL